LQVYVTLSFQSIEHKLKVNKYNKYNKYKKYNKINLGYIVLNIRIF